MPHFGVADAYKISMVGPGETYKCHTHWIASKLYFLFAFKCPGGGGGVGMGRLGTDRVISL